MTFTVERENDNIYKIDLVIPAKDAAKAYGYIQRRGRTLKWLEYGMCSGK